MAFCMNCGNKIPKGTKFCTNCGTPVPEGPAKMEAAAPAVQATPEPVVQAAPEPKPQPVAAPEPVVQAASQPVAAPAPQPIVSKPMVGLDIGEADMESGEMPEPIVGSYVMPGAAEAAGARAAMQGQQPAQSVKRAKQSGPKKRISPVIFIIAGGAAVLIAIIVVAAVLISNRTTATKAPEGTGTALVDLLDDAAYNEQMENN